MSFYRTIIAAAALGLSLAFSGVAMAQKAPVDPAALAAAKELLKASGASKNMDAVIPVMMGQMKKMIMHQSKGKTAEVEEIFKRTMQRFGDKKNELIDQIAALYATEIPIEDMKALTAFYSSGPGARFVAKQPQLIQKSAMLGQAWGRKIGQQIFGEIQNELRAKGITGGK